VQQNRLGCLTGTGIISALITILAISGVAFAAGGSLFSPGALNAHQSGAVLGNVHSHAETGGNCGACHTAPWDSATMADRCTACHIDIAVQMRQVAALHGQLVGKGSVPLACYDCHPDHRGPTAPLVDMTGRQFPHEALGYSLRGHAENVNGAAFTCQDCHALDIKTFDQKTCVGCHGQIDLAFTQAHLVAYGPNCLACHDGVDRFARTFSHARFAFTLTGRHADVACDKCHNHALTLADFAIAPKDCLSCHKQNDPHAGQFGQDCSACHASAGWTPAKFDHNQAAFKLTGAHANVPCAQCHVNNVFKGTPTDCGSCHKQNDPHQGQFGADCGACHRATTWKDVTFDHNKSKFPLTGAHARVPCTQCHSAGQFQGLSTACVTCHQDPIWHAGALGTDCASCHTTAGWSPAQFNRPHPSFGEEGGVNHGGAACRICHPDNVATFTCLACHDSNNPGSN
jgi:predicted CxxxxCH...CXXCH cytochrome family protein